MKTNQKGMSLIEIIIVIALVGILAGTSVTLIGHVHYANTKKTVESMDSALDKLQVNSMSKQDKTYLYIYKLSDGYYMKQLTDVITTFDGTKFDSNGTKLSGNSTQVYLESESGTLVDGNVFIRISYKKSGVFDKETITGSTELGTNVDKIVVKGNGTYTITLVGATGKHPIS